MTERPYTTGLYMLRCLQIGLSPSELHDLEYGMVLDMMIEQGNDNEEYDDIATQEDFDTF